MFNWKLFIPLLVFVALAFFLMKGLERDPGAMPSALLDRSMPEFSLPDLHEPDRQVSEAVFRDGEPALLNVWGTWCPACRVEHPFLMTLAERGVKIVGMDYKDERKAALAWLERLGDPYRVSFEDRDGRLGIDLGVYGAPETYLVDGDGVIRYKHVGVLDERVWRDELGPLYRSLVREEDN